MPEILFGTHNANKAREVSQMLTGQWTVLSCADFPDIAEADETGDTLEANARLKVEAYFAAAGLPCFADDTGLEVAALDGRPGVRSARYAGEPSDANRNIDKLLSELADQTDRKARFRTVFALKLNAESYIEFEGVLNGTIGYQRVGANGFGYDPVFIPEGYDCTLAELSSEEKNRISHRGLAVQKLIQYLKTI